MFQIKVNGILMPTIYWSMSDAINACHFEEEWGCAVRTEIVRVWWILKLWMIVFGKAF